VCADGAMAPMNVVSRKNKAFSRLEIVRARRARVE
jgi:hypothetical protein